MTGSPDNEKNLIGYGRVEAVWNVNGSKILKYQQEIWHEGLKEHKIISAPEKYVLSNKVRVQVEKWNEKWAELVRKKRVEDLKKATSEEAARRTREATERILEVENILISSLDVDHVINFESLKDTSSFEEKLPEKPLEPVLDILPPPVYNNSIEFKPKFNLLTMIFKSLRVKAINEAEQKYQAACLERDRIYNQKEEYNNQLLASHQKSIEEYNLKLIDWNNRKEEFIKEQNASNEKIDEFKTNYFSKDPTSVIRYCEMVLTNLDLPDFVSNEFNIDYNPETKILIVDYMLPEIEAFPKIKEVKYVASRNELNEVYFNDATLEKLFDATVYKLVLRVLFEEFQADFSDSIIAISLNGWVNSLNKATGIRDNSCIVSIQVKKEALNSIDLRNVDPKACFKNLKGIGSSKLANITPIQPILTLNKSDKRFIESYNVTNQLDDSTNLAAIPWEDFEHLIRELFENEFSSNGGEVKVTQASRDGGVDAVAFDPDPIRGGKIVIQAKRYTNTVGVSAVRDLYGTVMNEGATKGILVTTADYGSDAYEFANNKPLTLLNGGNLLHLMEKHGHKAKIDLKEAKILNLQ